MRKIGGREKMSDISSQENETEQMFWGEGVVLHYSKWNAYFLNDF